ncbi:hypothetical protein NIES25_63890 (plasmid) [Nostoc linckia NIES-25]|nr:hypothetical protein NIES25_63890 [Nostoc linckia NIES-25]
MSNKELETVKKLAFNKSDRTLEQPLSLPEFTSSLDKEKPKRNMNVL